MAVAEEHKPAEKRRALGRGLDSLLPSGPRVVPPPVVNQPGRTAPEPHLNPPSFENREGWGTPAVASGGASPVPAQIAELQASAQPRKQSLDAAIAGDIVQHIPLDQIDENPYQTRSTFDEAALSELAESIKANGLAQPVVVRPGANGRYVLVLGERRCRASKLAGKTTVAAIVRQLGNEQAAEMTIVENLQRQDLNCLEQAQAFSRLSREFNLTQEQIGQRTGVSRESVANYIRLLKLPKAVLGWVGEGKIGFSEARILLEATPYLDEAGIEGLARQTIENELTVKELKARLRWLQMPETMKPEPALPKPVDPNVKAAEAELQRMLGMRVRVTDHKGKGTVLIQYRSVEDFERLLDVLRARE